MNFLSGVIDMTPNISIITQIEALSWINADKEKEAIVKSFINDCNILPLSHEVVEQCIKIRRSRKIKIPDAILAATAIVYDLSLLTNDRDFNNILNLRVISLDPM